jgi:hypothetical protein
LQLADTLSVKLDIETDLVTERCELLNSQFRTLRGGCRTRNENASKRGYMTVRRSVELFINAL